MLSRFCALISSARTSLDTRTNSNTDILAEKISNSVPDTVRYYRHFRSAAIAPTMAAVPDATSPPTLSPSRSLSPESSQPSGILTSSGRPSLSTCAICNVVADERCHTCQSIAYCSVTCQKIDWPVHGHLCRQFSTSVRPLWPIASPYKRAILFHRDQIKVEIIWVKCVSTEEVGERRVHPDPRPFLGHSDSGPQRGTWKVHISRNKRRERDVNGCSLDLFYPKALPGPARKMPNPTVRELTNRFPTRSEGLHGPLVVMRLESSAAGRPVDYEDITLENFRDVVDYLTSSSAPKLDYLGGTGPETREAPMHHLELAGVKVTCDGDMRHMNGFRFSSINLPAHMLPLVPNPSPISRQLGLPIIVLIKRSTPTALVAISPDPLDVPMISAVLFDIIVPMSEQLRAKKSWRQAIECIYLLRRDCQDLAVQHVETMCAFVEDLIAPLYRVELTATVGITRPRTPLLHYNVLHAVRSCPCMQLQLCIGRMHCIG